PCISFEAFPCIARLRRRSAALVADPAAARPAPVSAESPGETPGQNPGLSVANVWCSARLWHSRAGATNICMNAERHQEAAGESENPGAAWRQELAFRLKWKCRDAMGHVIQFLHPRRSVPVLFLGGCLCGAVLLWHSQGRLAARAAQGEAEAQYLLGKRYYDDAGTPQDYSLALKWLGLAAGQRHAKAETALGLIYAGGAGVRASYPEAFKWLRLGAEQGEALAQNQLGLLFAQGKGAPQDLDQAIKWF